MIPCTLMWGTACQNVAYRILQSEHLFSKTALTQLLAIAGRRSATCLQCAFNVFLGLQKGRTSYLALIINDDLPLLLSKTLQGNGWSTNIYRYSYCQSLCSRLPGFDSELVQGCSRRSRISRRAYLPHESCARLPAGSGCQCRCACSAATGLLGRTTAMDCCFRLSCRT